MEEEIGNLKISKTFLISQLGYLLSMMDCSEQLMNTMQDDIDKFIFRTGEKKKTMDGRKKKISTPQWDALI